MPNAEYLKNKSGETFYPVVNVKSILFDGSSDSQPYTYTDLKQNVYNTIYALNTSTPDTVVAEFIVPAFEYETNRTNFFDIHNSNSDSNNSDSNAAILSDAGVHGIRIKNGTLQLTLNGAWKSTAPGPDSYKPAKVTKFRAVLGEKVAYSKPNDVGDSYYALTWTDPAEIENQTWAGTKIIRIATYKLYSSDIEKFYNLGSSVLTDSTYGKYCTLILDSKVKNKYKTNRFIDNFQEYLMGFVDKTITPIDTGNSTDEDILKYSLSKIYYMVIPYSEDGFEGTPTIYKAKDFGLGFSDDSIRSKYTPGRYCDFENNQTYYVGQNVIINPTPDRTISQWSYDKTKIQRYMNSATRVIVDKDGYVLGAFINPWGTTDEPENPMELKKIATKVDTVINATMICADSEAYENYDCNFELQDKNKPGEAYVSVSANQNFDVYGIGPTYGSDMSWLQKQVDAFVNYPTITPVSATIPANCTVSNGDYVIDKSFKEVTIDDSTANIYFRKWVYDPTGTKHKWKVKAKKYKSGEVVPVDIMVLQTLKYYKITVLETGDYNTVKKAIYSISDRPLDGYKPHPAFIQMINGKAVVVPYILTSAFPCTVVENSDNTTKAIRDCNIAPYYADADATSLVSSITDDKWSTVSSNMEIRSIPNVPPTVIASPKRIELLANKKSTEIKWRGIGYAQFALTQLRMLIELGTTNVDTLLHNHNDPASISATVLNKNGEDIKKYCWGTKYSPFMLCFPNSLPYNSFGGGFSSYSNTKYYNSTQNWRSASGSSEGTWNPDLIEGTSINYPGSLSNVNSDNKEMDIRINTNWHNELRYILQYSNSDRGNSDYKVEFVKTKSADIVSPGATWAMGNETAITYSIGALSMSANPNRNTNNSESWSQGSESIEPGITKIQGWKYRDDVIHSNPIDGSVITPLQRHFIGTIIPEQVSVTYSVLPAITSRADGTNTDGQTTVGPGEQKSANSDIIRCSIGKQILTPVFSFHGEENFGWGNYTPFNEDTIASYRGVFSMAPYHSRCMALLRGIAEADTEITSAVSKDFGYVFDHTESSGSTANYFKITCFGYQRRNDSAAYCSWKYPRLSDTRAFPWVINTRGNSGYYDTLNKVVETKITGDTSDILGVIMSSSSTDYNMGGESDTNWSYKHVSMFASAGWTGMALNSLNYDLNTAGLSYADTLKDNTTPEIGNYQPRIYTYPQ